MVIIRQEGFRILLKIQYGDDLGCGHSFLPQLIFTRFSMALNEIAEMVLQN